MATLINVGGSSGGGGGDIVVLKKDVSTFEEIKAAAESKRPVVVEFAANGKVYYGATCTIQWLVSGTFYIRTLIDSIITGRSEYVWRILDPEFGVEGWTEVSKKTLKVEDGVETALPSGSLADSTRYKVSAPVGTYAFAMASGHASGIFTTTASPNITFDPTAKFLWAKPVFEGNKTYEFDVIDNVWAFSEVVS